MLYSSTCFVSNTIHYWHKLLHSSKVSVMQSFDFSSTAASERVFSLLNNTLNEQQQGCLEDYIKTSVVLQYYILRGIFGRE